MSEYALYVIIAVAFITGCCLGLVNLFTHGDDDE
jgi:hypothetical protein